MPDFKKKAMLPLFAALFCASEAEAYLAAVVPAQAPPLPISGRAPSDSALGRSAAPVDLPALKPVAWDFFDATDRSA